MTILIYVIFEIIALFFLKLAQNNRTNGKHTKGKVKKSTIYLIISFCSLAFLVCFRDVSVGKDTSAYANVYLRIINGNASIEDLQWLGIGYRIICKIVGFFAGNTYYILNILVGFVTIYLFYKTIWENSEIPWLSIYILISTCLYYQTFNQARQMLAIAITFYALKYIKENNFKKYLIFILISTSIHSSAIVMIPFYLIANKKIDRKNTIKYIIIAFILCFGMYYVRKLLLMTTYGQVYFGTQYDLEGKTSSVLNFVIRICLLIMCFILGNKDMKEKYRYLYNSAIICTIIQLLTISTYTFGRVTTYFFISYILLIPNILPKKDKKIYIYFLVIVFALYHFIYYKSTAITMGVQEYKFFFH